MTAMMTPSNERAQADGHERLWCPSVQLASCRSTGVPKCLPVGYVKRCPTASICSVMLALNTQLAVGSHADEEISAAIVGSASVDLCGAFHWARTMP